MSKLTDLKAKLSALIAHEQEIKEQVATATSKLLGEIYATHRVTGAMATDLLAVAADPMAYPLKVGRLIERGLVVCISGGTRSIRRGSSSTNVWHELTEKGEEIATLLQPDGWIYSRPLGDAHTSPTPRNAPRG